jgi:hypothetical protein
MSLKSLQGEKIARFLGRFTILFPERELPDDRKCKVLMLSVLEGTQIEYTPAAKLTKVDPRLVRQQVLDTLNTIYQHNIFFPQISLRNFFISDDQVPKNFGFFVSFDGRKYTKEEDRQDHIMVSLANIRVQLGHLGYRE